MSARTSINQFSNIYIRKTEVFNGELFVLNQSPILMVNSPIEKSRRLFDD